MEDTTLLPFLNGSLGVDALDVARELVACRESLRITSQQLSECVDRLVVANELAERKILEVAEVRSRLEQLCEGLANMSAGVREYLGLTNS